MDVHLGQDFYESFIEYQTRMLKVFDRMTDEYGFHVLDASTSVRRVAATLRRAVTRVIESDTTVETQVVAAVNSRGSAG
jgi:thymidylate kinase